MRNKSAVVLSVLLLPLPAAAEPTEIERGFSKCASMCLQLSMRMLRHQVQDDRDVVEEVLGLCGDQCAADGLDQPKMRSIMIDLLNGMQKPAHWHVPTS